MKFPQQSIQNSKKFFLEYINLMKNGMETIDINVFEKVIMVIEKAIKKNKTIFTCGNGGSSSIADHFVCDFVKGVSSDTNISSRFVSLSSNMPIFSAIANDINYKDVFSFQLEKLGSENDILIAVSSSGKSKNIVNALKKAKDKNIKTISLVGFDGGPAKKMSDLSLHVNISNYGVVEDLHQSLMHVMSQYIRYNNLNKPYSKKIKF